MLALCGFPSQAQSILNTPSIQAVRSFLPVEAHYASAVQRLGVKGFELETAPGFTIRHGHDHWTGTGAAAFAQANSWMEGVQGGKVAVTVRRLTITGNTAVALTRELLTFQPITVKGRTAIATGTWYWKQTWQRTQQGWKLTVLEPISEKELAPVPPVEYTVSAGGDSLPNKSDVTEPQNDASAK